MIEIIFAILSIVFLLLMVKHFSGPRYPGPSLLEIIRQMNHKKLHLVLTTFAHQYGPVYQFSMLTNKMLIVSGYKEVQEVLARRGYEFAGRPQRFGIRYLTDGGRSFILNAREKPWRSLKKVVSSHMKMYGAGMDRLEDLFQATGEGMIKSMLDTSGEPFDPIDMIYLAAFKSIQILLTGQEADANRYEMIRAYEEKLTKTTFTANAMLLGATPWIRHFGNKTYRSLTELKSMTNDVWEKLKEDIPFMGEGNMTSVLFNAIAGTDRDCDEVTETDVKNTIIELYTAGISSTSRSFYALINLCMNHKEVMTKLRNEADTVVGSSRLPRLNDRPSMPYTRATLYELLRYTSVSPFPAPHISTMDSFIGDFPVKAGTIININLWALHHDDQFWGDPWAFRPERFLTEGLDDVVPADHPNRKHLLPFGAGPRVCVGENMAMARLFLWTVTLMQRVDFAPEVKHNPVSSDCRDLGFGVTMVPIRYKIRTSFRSSD